MTTAIPVLLSVQVISPEQQMSCNPLLETGSREQTVRRSADPDPGPLMIQTDPFPAPDYLLSNLYVVQLLAFHISMQL